MKKAQKKKELETRFSLRMTRRDYAKYLKWEYGQAYAVEKTRGLPNIINVSLPALRHPLNSLMVSDWERCFNGWKETVIMVVSQANERLGKRNIGLAI